MRTVGLLLASLAAGLALPGAASATGVLDVDRVLVGPADGAVHSSDGLISCPPACSRTDGLSRTYTLTAIAAAGSAFLAWTGCDSTSGPTCTIHVEFAPDVFEGGVITPRINRETVRVTFGAVYPLTVRRGGAGSGTVTSESAGISCGDACGSSVLAGTPVTLTATPARGSFFAGWRGDCSGTSTCTVALDRAHHVIAVFGRVLTARRLRGSPSRPRAGLLFTLRLELAGDPVGLATSCSATVGGKRIRLLGRHTTARLLVCRWRVPRKARGMLLRARLDASDAYADVRRTFAARVR